jgi:predicted metal-binding membrane protein
MHIGHQGDSGFFALTAMWLGMMTAMMAPVAWPWVAAFRTAVDSSFAASVTFAGGYVSAWLVYSVAAAAMQTALSRMAGVDAAAGLAGTAGAAALIGAGLYQFTPFKRACLTHCRSPFGYFLARWRNGPAGGFRLGLGHGLYCVGCCWALMATMLVVGVASVWWMAALTLAVFVEQVAPGGDRVRRPLGVALLVAGVARLL